MLETNADQLVRGRLCVAGKGNQGSLWRPKNGEEGREWQVDWFIMAPLLWLLLGNIGEPWGISGAPRGPLRVEVRWGTLRGNGDPWGVQSWEGVRQPPLIGLPIGEL